MKTRVYICNNDKKSIIDQLIIAANGKDFQDIEIVGSGPQDQASLKEIGLARPDVAVTGQLSEADAVTLASLSPETKIIMLCLDGNRGAAAINALEKAGFKGNTYLNLSDIGPADVLRTVMDSRQEKPEAAETIKDPMADFINGGEKAEGRPMPKPDQPSDQSQQPAPAQKPNPEQGNHDSAEDASKKIDIGSMRSKVITVYSRKGGTGKTTIAKELANLYSCIIMPSKVSQVGENLKVCLLDLDFEQGNVRSQVGIENPVPNVYIWLDDIIEKVASGVSIDTISYSKMQVMSRFVKKIDREFYVVPTDQGPIPQRLYNQIADNDKNGVGLYKKMISVIISALARSFDIVIIDSSSSFDEADLAAMEKSDVIVYPFCPTVADAENLKVFSNDLKDYDSVALDKVVLVENKMPKISVVRDLAPALIATVKYEEYSYTLNKKIQKNFPVIAEIDYDENVIAAEDSLEFFTNEGMTPFKKSMVKVAEYILPIFKVRPRNGADDPRVQKMKAKEKAALLKKKKKEDLKRIKWEHKHGVEHREAPLAGSTPMEIAASAEKKKEADLEALKAGKPVAQPQAPEGKPQAPQSQNAVPADGQHQNAAAQTPAPVQSEAQPKPAVPKAAPKKKGGFLANLFKKKPEQTYDEALRIVSEVKGVKKTSAGFPILPPNAQMPKAVSRANQKRYVKECNDFFAELRKKRLEESGGGK
jgi:cellulose biosynthesis protein BcsQ/rhodanese-related sulfurtransferase